MDLCNYLSESLLDDEADVTATSEKHMIIEDVYKQFVSLRIIKQDKFPKEWFDVDNRGRLILSPTKEVELNFSYWGWMVDYVKEHGVIFNNPVLVRIHGYYGKISDLNILDMKKGDLQFSYCHLKIDKIPNNTSTLSLDNCVIKDLLVPAKRLNLKSMLIDVATMESITSLYINKLTGKTPTPEWGGIFTKFVL